MIITSYIIRCKRAGVEPSIPVFYKLFKLTDNRDEHQVSTGYDSFALAQLTPNAISYILAFIILCEDKAVEASLFLCNTVFSLVEEPEKTGYCTLEPKAGFKLVQDLPKTPVIWKRKFITVRSRDWPHENFTLYRYATPWVRVKKFNLWNRNEKRALESFPVARPSIPLCNEVENLDSLEERMLTSYPHPRKMPVQCFLLYGMIGSKQRLAAMRRLRKKTSTQLEAGSGNIAGSGVRLNG
ncbi:hypothetical protein Dimus_004060 [Dionaea muscipula]